MSLNTQAPSEQDQRPNPLVLPWLVFLLIVDGWTAMIHPITRTNFGARHFGFRKFSGFIVLWMWIGHSVPPDQYGVFIFYSIVVFGLMMHHAGRANRPEHFGEQFPTYDGKPRVMNFLPVSEKLAKVLVEPVVITIAGLVVMELAHEQLGLFLIVGAGLSMFDYMRVHDRQLGRIKRMHNAEMDMVYTQQMYEEYKKGKW